MHRKNKRVYGYCSAADLMLVELSQHELATQQTRTY